MIVHMLRIKAIAMCLLCILLAEGCETTPSRPRIGVSLNASSAMRWQKEKAYMEERAVTLDADIDVRLNTADTPEEQLRDCAELMDSGIQVLILASKYPGNMPPVLERARKEKISVIAYSRPLSGSSGFYIGFDSIQIGRSMGIFLTELVHKGDYVILRGDRDDANSELIYEGVRDCLDESGSGIRILLDFHVPGWSPDKAKVMVKETVAANGNKVDAILAFNDRLAGAALEALDELGVTMPVQIVGCDATLYAVRRIARDRQAMTVCLDFKRLAYTAVDEAVRLARGYNFRANSTIKLREDELANDAILLPCQEIIKQNIDSKLIRTGYYTHEEIYGTAIKSGIISTQ